MGEMTKAANKGATFSVVGCDYSAAAKQPNPTWMAEAAFDGSILRFSRLENIGSDKLLVNLLELGAAGKSCGEPTTGSSLAVGLDFPFSVPLACGQKILARVQTGKDDNSWFDLAATIASMSYEELEKIATATSREAGVEPRRMTDALTNPKAQSPLHKINPGMLKMTWQGMAQLLELSKHGFSILPFADQSKKEAPAKSVMEVYPAALLKAMDLPYKKYKGRDPSAHALRRTIIEGISSPAHAALKKLQSVNKISQTPTGLELPPAVMAAAEASDDALDAVIAALGAALAQINSSNINRIGPQPGLSQEHLALEGWIYVPYPPAP